jgi:hypothetical protein
MYLLGVTTRKTTIDVYIAVKTSNVKDGNT